MGKYPTEKEMEFMDFSKHRLIMSKAIRLRCLDCCCFQEAEVVACGAVTCPLYPYRKGKAQKGVNVVTLPHMQKAAQEAISKAV